MSSSPHKQPLLVPSVACELKSLTHTALTRLNSRDRIQRDRNIAPFHESLSHTNS